MRRPHIAMKSSPRSRQLEKAHTQQQRPKASKKKKLNKKNLLKKTKEYSTKTLCGYKAKNIHYLILYRKSVPISGPNQG